MRAWIERREPLSCPIGEGGSWGALGVAQWVEREQLEVLEGAEGSTPQRGYRESGKVRGDLLPHCPFLGVGRGVESRSLAPSHPVSSHAAPLLAPPPQKPTSNSPPPTLWAPSLQTLPPCSTVLFLLPPPTPSGPYPDILHVNFFFGCKARNLRFELKEFKFYDKYQK